MGWAIGASFPAGFAGILALLGVAVLISVAMAGLSDAMGLLTRQRETLIAFSSTLVMPLTFLSGAFISLTLVPGWIQAIARFNPVNWAASAGRIAVQARHAALAPGGCDAKSAGGSRETPSPRWGVGEQLRTPRATGRGCGHHSRTQSWSLLCVGWTHD
jgi:hypothetical protein